MNKKFRFSDLRSVESLESRDLMTCDINPVSEIIPPARPADPGVFSDVQITASFGDVMGEVTHGSTISMGTWDWGERGELQLTIENLPGQNDPIFITRLHVPAGFRISEPADRKLADGESTSATILYESFSPSDCGILQVRIENGDESQLVDVELKARHPNAEAIVMLDGQAIEPGSTIDFGNVPIESTATRALMVRNDGDLELRLTQPVATPTFASQKSGVVVVQPETVVELPIDFFAAVPGESAGQFMFGTNDLDDQKFQFTLIGNATGNAPPYGDLNNDGLIDGDDLELIQAAMATGSTDAAFDLDSNGEIDVKDFDTMVSDIMDVPSGDANLDGRVDVRDFLILSSNFGKQDAVWRDGNFNIDRAVDVQDFLILSRNFGSSSEM